MEEIIKKFTMEEVKRIEKDLAFISAFTGIVTSLATEIQDDVWCDLLTLSELAQEKILPLRDIFIILKDTIEKEV